MPNKPLFLTNPHHPTMSYPAAAPAQPQICNFCHGFENHLISPSCYSICNRLSKFQPPGSRSRAIRVTGRHLLRPSPFRPVTRLGSMTGTPRIGEYGPILRLPVLYYLCCYCIALSTVPCTIAHSTSTARSRSRSRSRLGLTFSGLEAGDR